jgi:hypothetical protein
VSDWRASAACAGRDVRWWFTSPQVDPVAAGLAARLCAGCTVQGQCAREALRLLDNGQQLEGRWGGVWTGSSDAVARLHERARRSA